MKKSTPVGLVAAGNLTDSPLSRFRWLSSRLGPVKSASFRVARRIVNIIEAGHAVREYADLDTCGMILICVPDEQLPKITAELLSSQIAWRRKAVVIFSTWLDSSQLDEFSRRGAAIGSISPIPGFDETRYLVEGDRLAIREASSLVEDRERRAVAIERTLKPFYLAALTCTGNLLFTLLIASSEALHRAGIPALLSGTILDRQLSRTFRSFLRGGKNAYPEVRELSPQLRALRSVNPALAHYVEQSASLAAQLMEKQSARAARGLSQ